MRHIKRLLLISTICAGLTACAGVTQPVDTGYLPADAFGNTVVGEDQAVAASNAATNAFAYPAQMQGRPARMALAIASLDAMAGQFNTNGRWLYMDDAVKLEMLEARQRVRSILGVPPGTQSQSLIDHLVAASHDLDADNRQAALAALSGPDFSNPPEQTLALLAHFPSVAVADTATMNASADLFPQGGGGFDGNN
jgi:hypothetical protein